MKHTIVLKPMVSYWFSERQAKLEDFSRILDKSSFPLSYVNGIQRYTEITEGEVYGSRKDADKAYDKAYEQMNEDLFEEHLKTFFFVRNRIADIKKKKNI